MSSLTFEWKLTCRYGCGDEEIAFWPKLVDSGCTEEYNTPLSSNMIISDSDLLKKSKMQKLVQLFAVPYFHEKLKNISDETIVENNNRVHKSVSFPDSSLFKLFAIASFLIRLYKKWRRCWFGKLLYKQPLITWCEEKTTITKKKIGFLLFFKISNEKSWKCKLLITCWAACISGGTAQKGSRPATVKLNENGIVLVESICGSISWESRISMISKIDKDYPRGKNYFQICDDASGWENEVFHVPRILKSEIDRFPYGEHQWTYNDIYWNDKMHLGLSLINIIFSQD